MENKKPIPQNPSTIVGFYTLWLVHQEYLVKGTIQSNDPQKKKKKKPSKEQMHVVVAPSFQLSLTNNNFVVVACSSSSSRPSPTLK